MIDIGKRRTLVGRGRSARIRRRIGRRGVGFSGFVARRFPTWHQDGNWGFDVPCGVPIHLVVCCFFRQGLSKLLPPRRIGITDVVD